MLLYSINAYASDFVLDNENIWFVPVGYNYLCCYNLKQSMMKERIKLPIKNNKQLLYGSIIKLENKIILIPFKANCSIVYDISVKQIKKFLADESKYEEIYRACCVENNSVWMFPWIKKFPGVQYAYIKKINLDDGRTEIFEMSSKNMMPWNTKAVLLFNGSCVYIENIIYIGYRNYIIEIDLVNGCCEVCSVGSEKNVYTTMSIVDDERLCMIDIYGNAIIWNRKNRQFIEIKNERIFLNLLGFSSGYREGFGSSVVYKNEYVWFIPSYSDKALQLDLKSNVLSVAWFSKEICRNVKEEANYCGQFSRAHINGDYLYLWSLWDGCFYIISIKHHKIYRRYIQPGVDPNEFCSMFEECIEENKGICREEIFGTDGLDIFMLSISTKKNNGPMLYENVGKKITEQLF